MYTCDARDDATNFRVTVSGELPGGCLSSCGAHPAPRLRPTMCPLAEAPVRIVSSNEEAPHTYVAGQRVELWCQLSRPAAPVRWYKDGEEVEADKSLVLEQEGPRHRLVLPCARPQDTGEFVCNTGDVSVSYHISVAGWWHSRVVLHGVFPRLGEGDWLLRGDEASGCPPAGSPSTGAHLGLTGGASPGPHCLCVALHNSHAILAEPPVRILQPRRPLPVVTVSPGETLTLDCELSRADALVFWAKEGIRLEAGGSLVLEEEGAHRRLVIPTARAEHSGKYICTAADDTMTFTVQVSDPLVRILERDHHCLVAGEDLVLACELSRPDATVRWLRDGQEVQPGERVQVKACGVLRQLTVCGVQPSDSGGVFLCNAGDDEVHFMLHVKGDAVLSGERAVLWCELCKARGDVVWRKDGWALAPGPRRQMMAEGRERSLVLSRVEPEDAGEYCCESNDDQTLAMLTVQGELCPRLGHHPGDLCMWRPSRRRRPPSTWSCLILVCPGSGRGMASG
uniref:Obscurin like cytoskeletal adaptor 1 n=1 Tax=Strix occidentalis caurina TaxID=311401 RepID=A0A8D0ESC4_STROC